jgi:hypothetical protein
MFYTNLIKKTFIAAFVIVTAFSACKKPVSEPSVPAGPFLLKEFSDGTDTTRFTYNPDSSVKTITLNNDPISLDDNVTYNITYSANKTISELIGSNGTNIKATYDNGKIAKAEMFNGTIKYAETEYTYTAGIIESSTISLVDNGAKQPYFKSVFTVNNAGNISRTDVSMYNPFTDQLELTGFVLQQFDSKKNPFTLLGDVMLVFWQAASKNNTTKQDYFDAAGKAEEVVETTYTYNAQGYPVRATMKETQPGQQPTTAIITYKY